MRYYMNNYAAHPDYPSWFLFADDDYYVRTYKLWGILSNYNPHDPYQVVPTPNNFDGHVHGKDHDILRKTDYSLWGNNRNCSVVCTHASNVSYIGIS